MMRSEGAKMDTDKSKSAAPVPLAAWVPDERPKAPSTKSAAVQRGERYALPGDVQAEVRKAFEGTTYQREKMVTFLTRAAEAYDRHRYEEALRLAKTVADATPGVAPVRELAGLAAYRAERNAWRADILGLIDKLLLRHRSRLAFAILANIDRP